MPKPLRSKIPRWFMLILLYAWWLLFSGNYLWNFWRSAAVSGVDGSGHVAAVALYATHVYPDIHGWLPEFFGGMPFPVFYPPLFYWFAATLMKFSGIDATSAAKIITISSFAALPYALLSVGRRLGLSSIEATAAAAFAGVLACGNNFAAIYTIGFAWPLRKGALHKCPGIHMALCLVQLPAICATFAKGRVHGNSVAHCDDLNECACASAGCALWRVLVCFRQLPDLAIDCATPENACKCREAACLVLSAVMIAGIWWAPLISWHSYVLGSPQSAKGLFAVLGLLNLLWLPCILIVVMEWRRRPALVALCITLLLAAVLSLAPLDKALAVPFQPWRLISMAMFLATIPAALLCSRMLAQLFGRRIYVTVSLAAILVISAWYSPRARLDAAVLTGPEAANFSSIRAAMNQLPSGMILVEIIDLKKDGTSRTTEYEQNASRALIHQLAMDGHPVIWSIFREQAVSAAWATAVRNLFSATPEKFGFDGLGLQRASSDPVNVDNALGLAKGLGVAYYLVRSASQVSQLSERTDVKFRWEIGGWHLFVNQEHSTQGFETISSTPVLAWLPAHFRNRSAGDFDFFNLAEYLAFEGHPDICVLWAFSPGAKARALTSRLSRVIVLIDPSSATSADGVTLLSALAEDGPSLDVLLLDDGSPLANQINERRQEFAGYERLPKTLEPVRVEEVARRIIRWQDSSASSQAASASRLWRASTTYFPAWKTTKGSAVWLTGQGGMAVVDSFEPSLQWDSAQWSVLSIITCLGGIALMLFRVAKG